MKSAFWLGLAAGAILCASQTPAWAQYDCWANGCGISGCEFGCGAFFLEPDGPCYAGCTDSDGYISEYRGAKGGDSVTYCAKGNVQSRFKNITGNEKCVR